MPVSGANYAYRWIGGSGAAFQTGTNWASETAGAPPYAPSTNAEADFLGNGDVMGLGNVFDFNAVGSSGFGFVFTGYFDAYEANFAGTDWLTGGTVLTVASSTTIGHSTDGEAASVAILAGSSLVDTAYGGSVDIGYDSNGALGVGGAGALLNAAGNAIVVGENGGTGRLSVTSGGTVSAGLLDVGDQAGISGNTAATGMVVVNGGVIRLGGGNYGGEAVIGTGSGGALLAVNGFGSFTCSGLTIGPLASDAADVALGVLSVTGSVVVENQGSLNLSFGSGFYADDVSDAGKITQTGQYTTASVQNSLSVSGSYLLASQAVLTLDYATSGGGLIVTAGIGTNPTFTVDDATFFGAATQIGGSYYQPGNGTLVVQDSGTATLTSLSFNSATTNAPSAIEVTGAGSSLHIDNGGIYTGDYGAGAFTVSNGGSLAIGATSSFASLELYHGSLSVSTSGQVTTAGRLQVDVGSSVSASGGTLGVAGLELNGGTGIFSNGATLVSDTVVSDDSAVSVSSNGSAASGLSVSGSTTAVHAYGGYDALSVDSSTLSISAGATFTSTSMGEYSNALYFVAPVAGAAASAVDVTGPGSWLEVTGNVLSVLSSSDSLSVANGGTATINGSVIDNALNVTVAGTGSLLDVTGALSTEAEGYVPGGATLSLTGGAVADLGDGSHIVQLALGGTINVAGSLEVDGGGGYGTISTTGSLVGGGVIQASGGTLVLSGATLGGVLATGGGSTLVLAGAGQDISAMEFLAGGGTLVEANTAKLSGISGFGVGDFIDLTNIPALGESFANGTLTLSGSGGSSAGSLVFGSGFTLGNFAVSGDGHGGTMIAFHG